MRKQGVVYSQTRGRHNRLRSQNKAKAKNKRKTNRVKSSLKENCTQRSYFFHNMFNREYADGGTSTRVSHYCMLIKQGAVLSQTPACYNSLVSQAQEHPSQPSHKETYRTVPQRLYCLHRLFDALSNGQNKIFFVVVNYLGFVQLTQGIDSLYIGCRHL